MYTVILIDDEPVVREGMAYIINWEKEGFEIIGSAGNGIEGLALIRQLHPDLVITDIKMPGLTGLEMVKEAKKEQCPSKFIILSGYSDFKYAQNAISLGTLHYLLKPIDEEELIEILKKVRAQIDAEKKERKDQRQYKNYLEIQKLFSFIISGENGEGASLIDHFNTFQLMKFSKPNKKVTLAEMDNLYKNLDLKHHFLYSHGDNIFLLLGDPDEKSLRACVEAVIKDPIIKINISSLTTKIENLPKLYIEVEELDKKYYFFPNDRIISSNLKGRLHTGETVQKLMYKLKVAIKDNDKEEIEKLVDKCVAYFQSSKETVEIVKREWSFLFMECVSFLEESMNKPVKEIEKDKILSIIWKEQSIDQTAEFLKYVFYDFGRFFYQTNEKQNIVDDIKQYTSKNYHKNLSLKELAQEFNYSQSYLGKKFKAEMKESYHTYLDEVRLNQAKKLLKDENLYIYEIAKMIGYSNYDYFHKKFKNKFGISPKEYQKNWKAEELK